MIAQDGGDPAAVAFDAVNAGRARGIDVVMVDTAGRLPTQLHLMEELKKIRRVIGKADAVAPHEVLLVVDGNTGQNALAQIRAFDAAINLTGLVVTKLDGTAKGGTLAAVAAGSQGVRPVPVYWIGVGESLEDLQPFVADEFAGRCWPIDHDRDRALNATGVLRRTPVFHPRRGVEADPRPPYFQNGLLCARSSKACCASVASSSSRALIQPSANQACGCVAVHAS